MTTLIAPSRGMGYTDIYLDFIDGNGKAGDFYRAQSLESVAESLDGLSFPREKMAAILRRQNEAFGARTRRS